MQEKKKESQQIKQGKLNKLIKQREAKGPMQ